MGGEIVSDVARLVPAFRTRLQSALQALHGQGYRPVVHETWRSPERARALVASGKSSARGGLSMHCYGVAADVICGDHQWDCARHHCRFFETLGACAEDAGLTWGGRWTLLHDLPHVQGVPLSRQDAVRAAPDAGVIDGMCR